MTLRRMWVLAVIAVATVAGPAALGAELSEVLEDPRQWDGRRLTLVGEVVGDYSPRGTRIWVQVNDDPYVDRPLAEDGIRLGANVGIGVSIPATTDMSAWGDPGRFGVRGPVIEVTGTFWFNDPRESGETYLQADEVALVSAAEDIATPWSPLPLIAGVVLLAAASILYRTRAGRRPAG